MHGVISNTDSRLVDGVAMLKDSSVLHPSASCTVTSCLHFEVMGCTGSKIAPKYKELMKTPQFEKWTEVFQSLQLTNDEVQQLLRLYGKVDLDGGGTIDVVELLTVIDVERTPFTERIFTIFDEDSSGKIDFGEFVLALWNYCTLSKYALGELGINKSCVL
jgi:hypothetical protein